MIKRAFISLFFSLLLFTTFGVTAADPAPCGQAVSIPGSQYVASSCCKCKAGGCWCGKASGYTDCSCSTACTIGYAPNIAAVSSGISLVSATAKVASHSVASAPAAAPASSPVPYTKLVGRVVNSANNSPVQGFKVGLMQPSGQRAAAESTQTGEVALIIGAPSKEGVEPSIVSLGDLKVDVEDKETTSYELALSLTAEAKTTQCGGTKDCGTKTCPNGGTCYYANVGMAGCRCK